MNFSALNFENEHILILDNLFTESTQNLIYNEMTDDKFNWFLSEGPYTVSNELFTKNHDEKTFEYYQFSHNFIKGDGTINSTKFDLIKLIVKKIQDHFKCQFYFNRIKANLQMSVNTNLVYNTPHRDQIIDREHIVIIYYANDSDGKTFLFENDKPPWKIKKEIQSKKGRIVVFDGKYYHSGIHPKNDIRLLINFNIVGVENFS